jgi:hypothetical protein
MSVLSKPQKEWDDFLDGSSRPKGFWRSWRVLWVLIPAGILALVIVVSRLG